VSATPGPDYALVRAPRRATAVRLRQGREPVRCAFGKWGLSYQTCRFCDRGLGQLRHLNKYAVRHYVCDDCLAYFRRMPVESFRP